MKIIKRKSYHGRDTQFVAKAVWDFIGKDVAIPIKIDDTGLGGGVTDRLKEFKAKVIPINFAEKATQDNDYDGIISEMWFEFPVNEADIPEDEELINQLTQRLYDYDRKGRRKVEPKSVFKERYGKSPDKADALLLCYYTKKNILFSKEVRDGLKNRNKKGVNNYGF